jgi:predicted phage-related endonuclease
MERYTVTASSLGGYFGVGFNSPLDQLMIDLGQKEPEFDDQAMERMMLGNELEDAVLNFFEKKLGINIHTRNETVVEGFNGMMRLKLDGMATFEDEETVIECKVSNSETKCFLDDQGYMFQVQAYMEVTGCKQALLLGLWKGRPMMRLIKRDDDIIADIKSMVQVVYGVLNGILSPEDIPYELVAKYSVTPRLEVLSEITYAEDVMIKTYLKLDSAIKEMTAELDAIKNTLKNNYTSSVLETSDYKVTISEMKTGGTLDFDALRSEFPFIDYDKFKKPTGTTKTLRITQKKR